MTSLRRAEKITTVQGDGSLAVEAAYGGLDCIPETTISLTVLIRDKA
ncbi:4192_t:CDS:2 [Paraglomus occultum]|uniref:4192_t:CDS:1 n=1 Tax=Paraglomus occultum TaxID=144539 RepID=A0A9N8ZQU1_9GLOM|nr:4192_t:CDS:2 [Paraglomus occultum]